MMLKNKMGNVRSLLKVYSQQNGGSSAIKAVLEELEGQEEGEEKMGRLMKEKMEMEGEIERLNVKVGKLDGFVESVKMDNLKLENLVRKLKDFISRIFNSFSFYADFERVDDPVPVFNDFLSHLDSQNKQREATIFKAEDEIRKLRENLKQKSKNEEKQGAIKTHEKIISELNQKLHEKENELHRLNEELDNLKVNIEEGNISISEKEKTTYEEIEEKDKIIASHKSTLETMRSTILKLRDSLQNKIDELSSKEETIKSLSKKLDQTTSKLTQEIVDQKISLLSTIDSQLSSILLLPSFSSTPSVDALYNSILSKIKSINHPSSPESKEKSLQFELREASEKLEKKQKELLLMTKQKDTLRAQLGSAVEVMNKEEPRGDLIPSLEKHIKQLQEESRYSENTRDVTELLMESFERNDRKMREKLDKAAQKIRELKRQRGSEEVKEEELKEIKKRIRKEEVEKRDMEIERQRKVMAKKSEEQSILFNQKIEELEAKLEAKETEVSDLLAKLQDADNEIRKYSKDDKALNKSEGAIHTKSSYEAYDHHKNLQISNHPEIFKPGDETNERLEKMRQKNIKLQIVKKADIEGFNWFLLEQKETLDKPLALKSSSNTSKSSVESSPVNRKLFWVCEEGMHKNLVEYISVCTPAFLLKTQSIKITPDLMSDDNDKEIWNLLKEATSEIQNKSVISEKRQKVPRNNFLIEEEKTSDTAGKVKILEERNNELEDENLILSEEHKITMSINKEFYLFLNKLHSKIREMNSIIYEGVKIQPDAQFDYEELSQNLSKVKEFKTSIESDLNKLSHAVEKFRVRKSKPEKMDHPNSPASFDFDGDDNEIFGESFVIDSNNKELEEKLAKVEEELKQTLNQIEEKDKTIEDLKTQVEELEKGGRSSTLDMKKSESFEMMNSESISHIKNVLIQFL